MSMIKKILLGLVLFVFAGISFLALFIAGGVTDYNAELILEGPKQEVLIERDAYGVPYISAQNEDDAFFALGFAHAQDRLWQMTLTKHYTQGRLTELFGEAPLEGDFLVRSFGLARKVDEAWSLMSQQDKDRVLAYTKGVNAWISSDQYSSPPEFKILGLTAATWSYRDSLFASKSTLLGLAAAMQMELTAETLNEKRNGLQDFIVNGYPDEGHVAMAIEDLARTMKLNLDELTAAKESSGLLNLTPHLQASNNWVVSGNHTESAGALLSGDPHLLITMPSIWYLASISWPGQYSLGVTVPGVPVVYMGVSNGIAMAATINFRDSQDIYIEELNPDNEAQYRTASGWQDFEVRRETFKLPSGDTVERMARATSRGPVLPKSYYDPQALHGENTVASVQWTALLDEPDLTLASLIQVNRAKSLDEWLSALCGYIGPDVNIAFATKGGDTGVYVAGRSAIRSPDHATMGTRPSKGSVEANDWNGTYACSQNALVVNPESGILATANAQVVPHNFPYAGQQYFVAPGRQQRIQNLLDGRSNLTIEDMQTIQLDHTSLDVKMVLDALIGLNVSDVDDQEYWDQLLAWNGDWSQDSFAPVLFAYLETSLKQHVFSDELADPSQALPLGAEMALYNVFQGRASAWCDNLNTKAIETCGEIVKTSFSEALAKLRNDHGDNFEQVRWSQIYKARHLHPAFDTVPFLSSLFSRDSKPAEGRGVPRGPGAPNISVLTYQEGGTFIGDHGGPSMRFVVDIANEDSAEFVITSGQSGHFRSKHYDDIQALWERGQYLSLPRKIPTGGVVYRTRLTPSGG